MPTAQTLNYSADGSGVKAEESQLCSAFELFWLCALLFIYSSGIPPGKEREGGIAAEPSLQCKS